MRDTKDAKLIEVDKPSTLRDRERFHSGPGVVHFRKQGDGGTTVQERVGEGKTQERVLTLPPGEAQLIHIYGASVVS